MHTLRSARKQFCILQRCATILKTPAAPHLSSATHTLAMTADGPPTITTTPLFVTSWICPYVQRSWLILDYKKIKYDRLEVDLRDRPVWFKSISPNNKVPVLIWKDASGANQTLHESLVLNEYLAEAFPGPELLPADPLGRAQARLIINRVDQAFVAQYFKLLFATTKAAAHEAAALVDAEIEYLNRTIDPVGPFFLGAEFSLVDAALVPFLLRMRVLQHFRGYGYASKYSSRLTAYIEHASSLPYLMSTVETPEGKKDLVSLVDRINAQFMHYTAPPTDYWSEEAKVEA